MGEEVKKWAKPRYRSTAVNPTVAAVGSILECRPGGNEFLGDERRGQEKTHPIGRTNFINHSA